MIKRIAILILVLTFLFSLVIPAETMDDEKFLHELEKDSFKYFIGEANPENGLIKDSSRPGSPSSVAVVGFGLTALCIGAERGWMPKRKAYKRALQILRTFKNDIPHEKGFFYHFLDMRTGKRAWNSEISSIDTALFLAGALFAGEYFKGTEVERLSKELYERVEWPWMLNGKDVLCMGWMPESGFLHYYWDTYSEAMILYALAIGSPTHPVDKKTWFAWKRQTSDYENYEVMYSYFGSIFTYQYSHAWIDFRDLYEENEDMVLVNYFDNSIDASRANRKFCIDNKKKHKTYDENTWGLTACLGPGGYKGYGSKPGMALNDGTISPSGMAGSLVFNEVEALEGLKQTYRRYKSFLYGEYGFKDAFNVDEEWWSEEYLGLDVGITLLMIENYRTGMVWEVFMRLKPIQAWVDKCMFTKRG